MRYLKLFAFFTLATGAALARDPYWEGRDMRHDYQDVRHDNAQADRLRADIGRDRWQLNEDIRCGRSWAASRDAADLARDERTLRAIQSDIQRDRGDIHRDQRREYWERGYDRR
jgi:hypothetical protein